MGKQGCSFIAPSVKTLLQTLRRYPGQLAPLSLRLEVLQAHWPLAQTGQVSDKGKAEVHPVTCRDVTDGGRRVALLYSRVE
jgi:hypothetical protein